MKNLTAYCLACIFFLFSAGVAFAQKAGGGQYDPHILPAITPTSQGRFEKGKHYVRVEASSWFANNESNFLRNKLVSGTVSIDMGSGNVYQFVLDQYPLSNGNKIAPVFNQAILQNYVYRGENINVTVFLKGIKNNTAVGDLISNLASSSLNLANGAVGAMTAVSASPFLSNASKSLFDAGQKILNGGENQTEIFSEGGGLKIGIDKSKLVGTDVFLVAYRGNPIAENQLTIAQRDGIYVVNVGDLPLRQGAWVLFHIMREDQYEGARSWEAKESKVREDLDSLMQNWQIRKVTKADVGNELTATVKSTTLADRIVAVRDEISRDEASTLTERIYYAGRLNALLVAAQEAAGSENGFTTYFKKRDDTNKDIHNGKAPDDAAVATAYIQESSRIARESEINSIHSVRKKLGPLASEFGFIQRSILVGGMTQLMSDLQRNQPYQRLPTAARVELTAMIKSLAVQEDPGSSLWQDLGNLSRAMVKAPKKEQ